MRDFPPRRATSVEYYQCDRRYAILARPGSGRPAAAAVTAGTGSGASISFPAMLPAPFDLRRLLCAAGTLAVVLAACTQDKDPAAPRVDPLIGSYRLETINGGAVGAVSFVPDSIRYFADIVALDYDTLVTTVRWERDSFDLRDGGRYSNRLAYRLITDTVRNGATSGDTLFNDAVYHGSWSRSPVGIRFVAESIGTTTRTRLGTPDTFYLALPSPTNITSRSFYRHLSLGRASDSVAYEFFYRKL